MRTIWFLSLLSGVIADPCRASPGEPQPFPGSGIQWTPAGPNHVALDIDGDGRLDFVLAVDQQFGDITYPGLVLLRGDGFGNVLAISEIALPTIVSDLVVADLDSDGRDDLVARSGVQGILPLYSDGLGSFSKGAEIVLSDPSAPVVGDFDMDGDLDLAAIAKTTDQLFVFPRVPGGYGAPIVSGVDPTATLFTAVDFDSDGDLDVIAAGGSPSIVYLNTGDGSFVPQQSILSGNSFPATAVLAFDFENDGDVDLVRFGQIGRAFRNEGLAGFVVANELVTSTGIGTSIRNHDDDGDGDLDLWVLGNDHVLERFENRGDGFFDPPIAKSRVGNAFEFRIVKESIDGDRQFDVTGASTLFGSGSSGRGIFEVVRGVSSGELEIGVIKPPVVSGGSWIARARIDGDSLDDVFVISGNQVQAHRGIGGGFALVSTVTVTAAAGIVALQRIVDVDGDGRDDLVFPTLENGMTNLMVVKNDGSGVLTLLPGQILNIWPFSPLDFADIDGDLDADAIAIGVVSALGTHRTLLRNQSNVFSIVSQVPSAGALGVELADMNADGNVDLLVSRNPAQSSTPVTVELGIGNFGFGPPIALTLGGSTTGIESLRAADWNSDGLKDVLFVSKNQIDGRRIYLALQSPGLNFQLGPSALIPELNSIASVIDVNGDGRLDVEITNGRTLEQTANGGFDLLRVAGPTEYVALVGVDADPELERVFLTDPAVVNVLDTSCNGAGAGRFGHACTGLGGFAPKLSLTGCPNPGGNVVLDLERGPGGSIAVLLFSTTAAPQSFAANCAFELGGTILPIAPVVPLSGMGPGAGAISFPASLAANLPQFTVAIQAFVADSSRAIGYTTTNGIELVVR